MTKNSAAIIGLGRVGRATVHSLLKEGLFENLYLIDKNESLTQGVYLDFSHSITNEETSKVKIGRYEDLKECQFVIITAGIDANVTKNNGMKESLKMIDDIINNLKRVKYKDFIVIASNPVDLLTYYIYKKMNYPKEKLIGTGTLVETRRYKFILSNKLGVSPNAINGLVLGEHGKTAYPIFSQTRVYGIKLFDYAFNHNISLEHDEIVQETINAKYEIINKIGYTSYSIAESIIEIVRAICLNKGAILPVSIIETDGKYALSLPSIMTSNGVIEFKEIYYSKEEVDRLILSQTKIVKDIKDCLDL